MISSATRPNRRRLMPRPTPIPADVREAVLADIRAGFGRNAIARARGISAGSVSGIAREAGAFFPRCVDTTTATRARQIDLADARIEREAELWQIYLEAPLRRDGSETRKSRRASYALHDIERKTRPSHR